MKGPKKPKIIKKPCPTCHGDRKIKGMNCGTCDGKGWVAP